MIKNETQNWKFSLKWNRRRLKKILILGCCLGIALIIINTGEFFRKDNSLEVSPTFAPQTNPPQIEQIEQFFPEVENNSKHQLWTELMALRMESRRKRLQENCEITKLNIRGNDSLHRPNKWEFLINRPFRLVWCNVFKAASTSWMYNFNILSGYNPEFLKKTKEVPLELARKKYPRPSLKFLETALNDSTSFLIVRHPFERLLSGYRDKIEFAKPNTHHFRLGNHIITKYRPKTPKNSIMEFLKVQKRPTFFEFVEFLIQFYKSGKQLDMHWTPITTFCTPCQVRFDIIMKFETLQDDQIYLIEKQNLQNWIKPQWKNQINEKGNIVKLLKKYYNQLNVSQIYQLYYIYRYDFYLFDYKPDEYFKYLNSGEENDKTSFKFFF